MSGTKKIITGFLTPIVLVSVAAFAAEDETRELDPIVVVASKAPRPISEVAGQVTIVESEDIEKYLLEDLDELLRYEPGLSAETSGTRFGVSGVNIRGIGGNRVALEIDGVPLRNRFAIGSYSNAGNDLVEAGRIKRLEVLHGPASSLYGSDALGGVMSFTTLDPDDLLRRGQGDQWYGLRGSWRDEDQSWSVSGSAAWVSGAHGLMVSSVRREGHERDNNNPAAINADPSDWTSENHALRWTWDTPSVNRLRISAEQYSRQDFTEVNSILGFSRFRSTTSLNGDDEDESTRLLVDFEFSGDAWEHGVVRAFSTDTRTSQLTLEERATGRNPSNFERYFDYRSRLDGMEFNLFRTLAWGRADHRLGAGLEWLRTRSEELRDGWQQSIEDGSITKTVLGETLPVRDFPNSTVDETSLFVQDEISIGRWQIIPALRWDRFDLDPEPDAIYLEDYPDTEIVSVSHNEITPRLGVVTELGQGWSAYAQYVEGFRAPPHEDANIGFDISVFKFRAIPNPDLKPERSQGIELGIRQLGKGRWFSLAWFETDFEDFIQSRAPVGVDPQSGWLLFQSRNIGEARIRGLDLRFEQDLADWWEAWEGLRLKSALYWSEGDNLDNGQPLNSVSPPQAILGVSWTSADQRFSVDLIGTFTKRQDRVDHTASALFETPGYSLFDLSGAWRITQDIDLRVGIRNLEDRQYWRWTDVSKMAAQDPMLQLLSRPGRSYNLSLNFGW